MITAREVTNDDGAAVVWTLALLAVLLLVGLAAAAVSVQAVARQRVATTADIVALAGAQAFYDACGTASRVADANGAALVSCAYDGTDVIVTVSRPAPEFVRRVIVLLGGKASEVSASARAGPP